MEDRIIELAIQIQQIAAPTFNETERAKAVFSLFQQYAETLRDIELDSSGNVYARYPGLSAGQPLVVSAHLDTVFPLDTSLSVKKEDGKVYGPGIGDNSISVACLVAAVEQLIANNAKPQRDIWFCANIGEEGLGDLIGMKRVVDRFGAAPRLYLVLEGLGVDHLIHQGIGVKRYRIFAHSKGGHSWADFGIPSAIHELSELVSLINQVQVPKIPKTTYNVGKFSGGTSINTIAAEASIELDLRSQSAVELRKLDQKVLAIIEGLNRTGSQITFEKIGERASGELDASHPLLAMAQGVINASGMEPILMAGSTDANVPLSKGYPSFVMGITRGGGTHTVHEYIETADIGVGFANYMKVIELVCNTTQAP